MGTPQINVKFIKAIPIKFKTMIQIERLINYAMFHLQTNRQ